MDRIDNACCAHSIVRHHAVTNGDGTMCDEWRCRDCGHSFSPVPHTSLAGPPSGDVVSRDLADPKAPPPSDLVDRAAVLREISYQSPENFATYCAAMEELARRVRTLPALPSAPDLCVAFPGGRGTADCVRRCRAAGIEVAEVKR